ncbi:MAG: hypothetical protein CBC49_003005 [Alphaproteobacteria bacterium TMED89]|nr:MAG: hypothetical protein CBC49_003005 [Alphaproteobacteria bacterium TMED89]
MTRREKGHFVLDAHVREQGVILKHHRGWTLSRRDHPHVGLINANGAAGLVVVSGNHAERGGLAAT